MILKDGKDKCLDPRRIARSIARSMVRKEIHLYLCDVYPKVETVAEIIAATGYDERSILGALIGDGDKYKPEDSLVAIRLVTVKEEEYHGDKVMIFSAISNGKEVDELLRGYASHNNLSTKLKVYTKDLEKTLKKLGSRD